MKETNLGFVSLNWGFVSLNLGFVSFNKILALALKNIEASFIFLARLFVSLHLQVMREGLKMFN